MFIVRKYNAERDGVRRCTRCFDTSSNTQTLNELILGTMQIILCKSCLEDLQKMISDRLVESDLEE